MKKLIDHIEHIKTKPHHIRKRVALGVAACTSGFVALVWLAASFSTNAFAIQGSSFADAQGQQPAPVVKTDAAGQEQGLAGVGAAAILQDQNAPAHIEIVDTAPAAPAKKADATILPF
jgi:uncharacterized protein YjdB